MAMINSCDFQAVKFINFTMNHPLFSFSTRYCRSAYTIPQTLDVPHLHTIHVYFVMLNVSGTVQQISLERKWCSKMWEIGRKQETATENTWPHSCSAVCSVRCLCSYCFCRNFHFREVTFLYLWIFWIHQNIRHLIYVAAFQI